MTVEQELGLGIEEIIQTSITANFAMENYFGKTNNRFFEEIMNLYDELEQKIDALESCSDADKGCNDLSNVIWHYNYHQHIIAKKREAISLYLARCDKIAKKKKIQFDPEQWFQAHKGKTTEEEHAAILGILEQIRIQEELQASKERA